MELKKRFIIKKKGTYIYTDFDDATHVIISDHNYNEVYDGKIDKNLIKKAIKKFESKEKYAKVKDEFESEWMSLTDVCDILGYGVEYMYDVGTIVGIVETKAAAKAYVKKNKDCHYEERNLYIG